MDLLEHVYILENLPESKGVGYTGKTAFLFSGRKDFLVQAAQELLEQEKVFKEKMEKCDFLFTRLINWSLINALKTPIENNTKEQEHVTLFSLQYSLTNLWISRNVKPDSVVAATVGEAAGSTAAGIMSPEEAGELVIKQNDPKKLKLEGYIKSPPLDTPKYPEKILPFFSFTSDEEEKEEPKWENLNYPKSLEQAIQELLRTGHEIFVEISPKTFLFDILKKEAKKMGVQVSTLASFRDRNREWGAVFHFLEQFYQKSAHLQQFPN